jgi:hypothetical protein
MATIYLTLYDKVGGEEISLILEGTIDQALKFEDVDSIDLMRVGGMIDLIVCFDSDGSHMFTEQTYNAKK